MDLTFEETKRAEFRNILFSLAETDFSLKDAASRSQVYQRLERLYSSPNGQDRFRHFYSDIFIVLTTIHQGDRQGSIEVLGQNLGEIRRGYQPNKNKDENGKLIDISDALKKLYDHVSLDIARINYSDGADRKVGQEENISAMKATVTEAKEYIGSAKIEMAQKVDDVEAKVHKVESRVRNVEKEYVAILGIFAAIVMAFTAGIAFSTSVLENMHKVSVYRTIAVVLIIGFVLINALFGLFYCISRLVNGKGENGLIPLIITDACLIILLGCTVLAWYKGFVENRNSDIASRQQVATVGLLEETKSTDPEDVGQIELPKEIVEKVQP